MEVSGPGRGALWAGRLLAGLSFALAALALWLLVALALGYSYFHDDVGRSAATILTAAAINVATLGLGLASVRQALRYRRGDSRLRRVGAVEALAATGLVLTFLWQLGLDHH